MEMSLEQTAARKRLERKPGDVVVLTDRAGHLYDSYQIGVTLTIDSIQGEGKRKAYRVVSGDAMFLVPPGHIKSARKASVKRKPLAERLAETFDASPAELRGMIAAAEERKAKRTAKVAE